MVTVQRRGVIGFDAGDQSRSATVLDSVTQVFTLEETNSFRIDGIVETAWRKVGETLNIDLFF